MLACADLAIALDPASIMRRAGLTPDPWQAEVLRSTSPEILLLCTRQGGKSTTTAAIAIHDALYNPPALVLCLSPSLRQSGELFMKVMGFYEKLGRPVPIKNETSLTVQLANGSRIVALPGTEATIRGYSGATLLLIDEAARVDDALYYSVRPMLAVSGGRLIVLSTPFGKRGFFHEEWENGIGWERYRITAYDCPRIPRAYLENERIKSGDYWFSQEYLCEFQDTSDQIFSYETVLGMMSSEVQPLDLEGLL